MGEALPTRDLCNSRPSYCFYMLGKGEKTCIVLNMQEIFS